MDVSKLSIPCEDKFHFTNFDPGILIPDASALDTQHGFDLH